MLPSDAVHLASSERTDIQAFRVGRAVYGIQFHFEADRQLVEMWSRDLAALIAEHDPDWPGRHPRNAAIFGPKADAAGRAIARAWVGLVQPSSRDGRPVRKASIKTSTGASP